MGFLDIAVVGQGSRALDNQPYTQIVIDPLIAAFVYRAAGDYDWQLLAIEQTLQPRRAREIEVLEVVEPDLGQVSYRGRACDRCLCRRNCIFGDHGADSHCRFASSSNAYTSVVK